jgi:prepilin signal peptidase PulO-like enzyme (type II secretory pathway)
VPTGMTFAHPAAAPEASAPRLAFVCALLLLLIGLLILMPENAVAQSVTTVVTAAVLIAAVHAARVPRRFVVIVSAVAGVAATASVVATAVDARTTRTADTIVLTVLVVAVPVAIIFALHDERTVSMQTVFGAISIYLVIGVVYALLMTLAGRFSSEAYFAQGGDGSLSQRVYFSYVTLATLGYGDLTPATGLGRLLAVSETIIGNLYLVTAVSLVVSRVGRPRRNSP